MIARPRHRLAHDAPLSFGGVVRLEGNAAHYLTHVLRLKPGEAVALFNSRDGEWRAELEESGKRHAALRVAGQLRPPQPMLDFWVCFAPIKGGRMETIIEKATELGASVLQPVLTQRCVVDKVNIARAESIAREAAEQCERIDWPEIREPVKLPQLLGNWPAGRPLLYGDETGDGGPIAQVLQTVEQPGSWAILAGPEGGFAAQELAALRHCPAAKAVGLGPRILRADTAIITLSAITLSAWGDWRQPPRFQGATA